EAFERRERAVQEQLDVAELTHREIPGAQIARAPLFLLPLRGRQVQILQFPSVGFLERSHDLLLLEVFLAMRRVRPHLPASMREKGCTAAGKRGASRPPHTGSCPFQLL